MVLVFKTSVTHQKEVEQLAPFLDRLTGGRQNWNFDLEDCDCILRIESVSLTVWEVIPMLEGQHFYCEELEDVIMSKA